MRWTLALLLVGCGGKPPVKTVSDDLASLPNSRPAAQTYVVLTADAQAMQTPADVEAMWAAVDGKGDRYAPIRAPLKWVPSNYKLDVELDFADLPHPEVSVETFAPLLAKLDPATQAKAQGAKLAVIVRAQAATLPDDNHLRLAGAAALYAADSGDGVIIDMGAQRAWSRDDWRAALINLDRKQQIKVARKSADGQVRFISLGAAKFGAPELTLVVTQKDRYPAGMQRFTQVLDALLDRGGAAGQTVAGQPLSACASPHPSGAPCVQIPSP